MDNIIVDATEWQRYTSAVKDRNLAHESDEAARGLGLDRMIAPGMYIASKAVGGEVSGIKTIKFSDMVYDGDVLNVTERQGMLSRISRVVKRGETTVCEINGIRRDDYSVAPEIILEGERLVHKYSTEISPGRTALFLEGLGYAPSIDSFPSMFIASLSAPAVLDLGALRKVSGLHASQGFAMHEGFRHGPIDILMGNEKIKGPIHSFDLQWTQQGRVIASGRSTVLQLEDKDVKTSSKD
jgi:hypothetical protein